MMNQGWIKAVRKEDTSAKVTFNVKNMSMPKNSTYDIIWLDLNAKYVIRRRGEFLLNLLRAWSTQPRARRQAEAAEAPKANDGDDGCHWKNMSNDGHMAAYVDRSQALQTFAFGTW